MTTTINIGLAIGDRDLRVSEHQALAAILGHTGDRPISYAIVQSDTEQTLVAVLEEGPTAAALYALCAALDQECVAIQTEGQPGEIVGPRAADWGPFDPARFISWSRASVMAARSAVTAAEIEERRIERAFEDDRAAARLVVEKQHAEARNAASRALGEARRALLAAENAAAPVHEWEGRKVVMREPKNMGSRWNPRPSEKQFDEQLGVVVTYKHGMNTGPGRKWFSPGDPMVRLLKKDGTVGLRTVKFGETGAFGAKWELV